MVGGNGHTGDFGPTAFTLSGQTQQHGFLLMNPGNHLVESGS
jgi:hypothetical protein